MKDLSLHVLDLAQNSVSAGATRVEIGVDDQPEADTLSIAITDNGCGMPPDMVRRVQDPFVTSRTTRKVGLGIPLFKNGCESCGGHFSLTSTVGVGTTIAGTYQRSHIDRPPLGDMAGSMMVLIMANPELDFIYRHRKGEEEFLFDLTEIRAVLGDDVPLTEPSIQQWMSDCLTQGLNTLYGGIFP